MSQEPRKEQIEAFYSGRVQGVGFRYTVLGIARGLPVTGFVRNLPDGRVQVLAEGTPEALGNLLREIETEFGHHVRGVEKRALPATGEFRDFRITHGFS